MATTKKMNVVTTDPIADMLTRIRNAIMVRREEVEVPKSKIKMAIAKIAIAAILLHFFKFLFLLRFFKQTLQIFLGV